MSTFRLTLHTVQEALDSEEEEDVDNESNEEDDDFECEAPMPPALRARNNLLAPFGGGRGVFMDDRRSASLTESAMHAARAGAGASARVGAAGINHGVTMVEVPGDQKEDVEVKLLVLY